MEEFLLPPERWQEINHLVNSALGEDSQSRTRLLQQSCADDFALQLGAEALLSVTRKLPDQPLAPDHWQRIEQVFQAALEMTPSKRSSCTLVSAARSVRSKWRRDPSRSNG